MEMIQCKCKLFTVSYECESNNHKECASTFEIAGVHIGSLEWIQSTGQCNWISIELYEIFWFK